MRPFVVLMLFVAVGVGGYVWYIQVSEPPEELAASSGLPPPPVDAFLPAPVDEEFNMDKAFNLAGSHVPTHVSEFYLQNVDPELSMEENVSALQGIMSSAIKDSDFLAVIGADVTLTFDVFNAALDKLGEQTLKDVIIIYLGGAEHQAPLKQRVEDAGGEFRFSAYPLNSNQV